MIPFNLIPRAIQIAFILATVTLLGGCANIHLGPSYDKPLKEQVVRDAEGAKAKVLLIEVNGKISDEPQKKLFGDVPSLMDSVLMQLQKAEKDKRIQAVVLKVNSPGGGVTASDVLYHELLEFKRRTGKILYVQMMDVAASGGYYIALAADHIQAHPTTVTGSVGVVSIRPDLSGTMQKVGVAVNVYKSGVSKDMGSPFRPATEADKRLYQSLVESMAERFYDRVQIHRHLDEAAMQQVKTARVFTGQAARKVGLVDSVGYLSEALDDACKRAGAPRCEVVTYRYRRNPNATVHSPTALFQGGVAPSATLLEAPLLENALQLDSGLYYLYLP